MLKNFLSRAISIQSVGRGQPNNFLKTAICVFFLNKHDMTVTWILKKDMPVFKTTFPFQKIISKAI